MEITHFVLGGKLNEPLQPDEEEILFGCGCFWGAEKGFWKLPGIKSTAVGYAGGEIKNPNYRQVCSGQTGHAEVIKIVWNKNLIDLSDLLKLFWECHDPTQQNRQGNDQGTQYRSAIFTSTIQQFELAIASRDRYQILLSEKGFGSIATDISPDKVFYYAEEYHQQYLAKPGSRPYCSAMPLQIALDDFPGSNYKLSQEIWSNYDWSISHCILRSDNAPIPNN